MSEVTAEGEGEVTGHERRETRDDNHGKLLVQVFIKQNEDQFPSAFDFDGAVPG